MTMPCCLAINCTKRVPKGKLMCKGHWALTPMFMKKQIVDTYTIGQVNGVHPNTCWITAVRLAIAAVHEEEKKLVWK